NVTKTKPGIQPEDGAIALHGVHYLLSFANGSGHRFLTPDVLSRLRGLLGHNAVPVRRSGNMHHINIILLQDLSVVSISPYPGVTHIQCLLQMIFIDITNSHQPGSGIGQMPLAHISYPNYSLSKLVAGSRIAGSTQHMSGHNTKCPKRS